MGAHASVEVGWYREMTCVPAWWKRTSSPGLTHSGRTETDCKVFWGIGWAAHSCAGACWSCWPEVSLFRSWRRDFAGACTACASLSLLAGTCCESTERACRVLKKKKKKKKIPPFLPPCKKKKKKKKKK